MFLWEFTFPRHKGELEEEKEWVQASDDTLAYSQQKKQGWIEQCDQVCIRIIRCFITS